jgi:fibronectin-binding autotransporter adhesin
LLCLDASSCERISHGPSARSKSEQLGTNGGINDALTSTPNTQIVDQTGDGTITTDRFAYALKVDNKSTITINSGKTLTLGDGTNPAGLILGGSSSNSSNIKGGILNFGGSEAVIYSRSTGSTSTPIAPDSEISSEIRRTNGLTLAGEGNLLLSNASPLLTGPVNIDSGTLILSAANALTNVSSVNLSNVKSSPAAAGLTISASNAFASLNSTGSNSSVTVSGANTVLTIGQTGNTNAALNNLNSTIPSTITATDVAAGSTAIVKAGTGMLDLSGAALNLTAGSNVAVNAGTLRVSASAFKNTNNIVTAAGSEVQFAQNAGGVFAGNVTGAGALHLIGGVLQLTGTGNSYSGGTIVERGSTLDLTTANVSSGNANIVNAGGLIVFDQATSGVYSGVISDGCQMQQACATKLAGSLVKDDSTGGNGGNVTIGAVQAYTGGTFIEAGTLTLGTADAISSSAGVDLGRVGGGATATLALAADNTIQGLMSEKSNSATVQLNDKTLTVNTANGQVWDFGGSIIGTGSFVKSGAGIQILSGDTSFSGGTTISGGALAVNGKLGGTIDVLAGGRLQGIGTVGDTIVSGTIAPGNSIGTLNVAGNITFNPNSTYEVEVNGAGASDKIIASGTATIDGGSVQVLAGAGIYAPQTQYTILTATGGLTANSAFSGVTSNLAFLNPTLSYDAKNVYLTLIRNGNGFADFGLTLNQIATGGAAENLGGGNAVYDAVLGLSASQAQYAFDQLSGEVHASARTALIEDSRFIRNAVNDRIRAAFDGADASGDTVITYADGKPRAVAANTDRFAFWTQGFGSWGHTDGDGNAARLNRSTGGVFIGADAPVFDTWRFGAVAGYSRTSFDAEDRHSSGSSDNYHVGLYGGTQWGVSGGDLAFRTGAAYTWHDISTDRSVVFPGFGDSLKGDYNAATAQVFGDLAYGINMGAARFEPFANLAYVNLHTDGFTEKGGAAALTGGSANTDATLTTLGLRASTTLDLNGAAVMAKGTVGWRHAFGDVTPLSTMRFAGGGDAFAIGGVPTARNAAVVEAGLDFALTPDATLGVSYSSQFGRGLSDQSVRANLNMKF